MPFDSDDEGTDQRTLGNYSMGKTLGTGMSAKVKLGKDLSTGQEVALKIIDRAAQNDRQLQQLYREVEAMKTLRHDNILQLLHSDLECDYPRQDGSTHDVMLLVLELATGGELFDFLMHSGAFQENIARTYCRQLFSALALCHENNIFHRDIKPENLLLDDQFQLKVADFGLSSIQQDPDAVLQTECGTRSYMAPEVMTGQGYDGAKADVWSAGVVLFIVLGGNPPMSIANRRDWWFNAISLNRYDRFWAAHLRSCPHFPEQARELVNRIFRVDPEARPSAADILEDEWMQGPTLSPEELHEELSRRKRLVDEQKARERAAARAKKAQNKARNRAAGVDPFARNVHRDLEPEHAAPAMPDGGAGVPMASAFYTADSPKDVFAHMEQFFTERIEGGSKGTVEAESSEYNLTATVRVDGEEVELDDGETFRMPDVPVTVQARIYAADGSHLVAIRRTDGDVFTFKRLYQALVENLGTAVANESDAPEGEDAEATDGKLDILPTEDEEDVEGELPSDGIGMI